NRASGVRRHRLYQRACAAPLHAADALLARRLRQRKLLGGRTRSACRPPGCRRFLATGCLAMTAHLQFDPIRLPPECDALRAEVRTFLAEESAAGTFDPHQAKDGDAHSRAFSRRVGAKGWIGMTWPRRYGGHERSYLERYVVTEEFHVATPPVRLHFVPDPQPRPIFPHSPPD